MDIVDKSVKNSKFPKIFSVKLLTLQEVVLRCVHAKQIPKLSEAVGGQMVVLIGRLSKSSKIGGELENSNFFFLAKLFINSNFPFVMRIS